MSVNYRWAQAGNTPLRWYKQNTYGGGVRDPLIAVWPAGIVDAGGFRRQFCHAVDIAPTILAVTGAPVPDHRNGVAQIPVHGKSLTQTFTDGDAPAPRQVQYFEQMGHRGLWSDGWKITTYHTQGQPLDDDEWALYHLDEDFSEGRIDRITFSVRSRADAAEIAATARTELSRE